MFIYSKNTIIFSVSIPISSQDVTQKISKTLNIDNDQAEKAKIICGLDEGKAQGIIYNILIDNIKNLNKKISEIINFYENHYQNYEPLNKIILCGGGAIIKNLDKLIEKNTNIKTELGDIETNINETKKIIEKIFTETHNFQTKLVQNNTNKTLTLKQNSGLSYTTAIGLALRNINLDV